MPATDGYSRLHETGCVFEMKPGRSVAPKNASNDISGAGGGALARGWYGVAVGIFARREEGY